VNQERPQSESQVSHFIAEAAFIAVLRPDGAVVVQEILDPGARIVVVAEYRLYDNAYIGFYHEDLDCWEIIGSTGFYRVSKPGSPFYGYSERTVLEFRDQLLSSPQGDRLTRSLAREIREAIDRGILRDLATWMVGAVRDLREQSESSIVGYSRLVS